MARTITFTIPGELADVALAAAALRGVCQLTSLGPDRLDELEIGVVEAINNVIEHGFDNRPPWPIEIELQLHRDRIAVRITDRGTSIPTEALDHARAAPLAIGPGDSNDPDSLPESGMGLKLLVQCVDAMTYRVEDDCNHLLLEKRLPG